MRVASCAAPIDSAGSEIERPGGQRFHQHAPAVTDAGGTADDRVERNEHIGADDRTVMERHAHGVVALADVDAGRGARDQRAADAQIFDVAEQFVRVLQAKRKADQRGDRRQRDVALSPVEAHSDDFLTVDHALLDDAFRLRGGGIRTRFRAGQGKAGDLLAACQARQVALFLFRRAVIDQQFAGAERVGNHHRDRSGNRAAGDARDHSRVPDRGEAETAVLLRDDHAKEALLLDEGPDIRRQIASLLHVPVVDPAAQFLDGTIEERQLLGARRLDLEIEQFLPRRDACEQVGIPPDRAGIERDALRFAQARQNLGEEWHDEARNDLATQRRQAKQRSQRDQRDHAGGEQRGMRHTGQTPADQQHAGARQPGEKTEAAEREDKEDHQGQG